MKTIKTLSSCLALSILFLNSCKKKEETLVEDNENTKITTTDTESANAVSESRVISVEELSSSVTIVGATKNDGAPPAPNSNLEIELSDDTQLGVQGQGFEIKFSSDDDIQGAYIVLKDVDGNSNGEYFDVPVTNNSYNKPSKHPNLSNTAQRTQNSVSDEYSIDVDFDQSLSPGQFCYEICLYNVDDQIYQIQEVCINVKAWGGNNEIIGSWELVQNLNDDPILDYICDNGSTLEYTFVKYFKKNHITTFNTDGTYSENSESTFQSLNYLESINACSLIYNDLDSTNQKFTNNWTYDIESKKLIQMYSAFGEDYFVETNINIEGNKLTMGTGFFDIDGSEVTLEYIKQ